MNKPSEHPDKIDRHILTLIILVDDKPVIQGKVEGDDLDAMLLCASIMKSEAMHIAEVIGTAIDTLRERYDAEPGEERSETDE